MTDLLIRGGTVIDGTGAPGRRADVAIRGGRIAAVGAGLGKDGARIIDAKNRVISPGFIDIHSHSDEAMFVNDALESALHMGVTLVVCGNCGGSSAPVSGLAEAELDRELSRLNVQRTWSSFGEYADAVDRVKPAINVCSFVGHGTLRSCVMGADDRAPTKDELARMRALLTKSMDEGAIGLASGLIYPPSAFAIQRCGRGSATKRSRPDVPSTASSSRGRVTIRSGRGRACSSSPTRLAATRSNGPATRSSSTTARWTSFTTR